MTLNQVLMLLPKNEEDSLTSAGPWQRCKPDSVTYHVQRSKLRRSPVKSYANKVILQEAQLLQPNAVRASGTSLCHVPITTPSGTDVLWLWNLKVSRCYNEVGSVTASLFLPRLV